MVQINHSSLVVPSSKREALAAFLVSALCHLGQDKDSLAFVIQGLPADNTANDEGLLAALKLTHIAFTGQNQSEVHEFHAAALKAGGIDNGPPGPRSYFPGYYSAFIRDPVCGVNWEVVFYGK